MCTLCAHPKSKNKREPTNHVPEALRRIRGGCLEEGLFELGLEQGKNREQGRGIWEVHWGRDSCSHSSGEAGRNRKMVVFEAFSGSCLIPTQQQGVLRGPQAAVVSIGSPCKLPACFQEHPGHSPTRRHCLGFQCRARKTESSIVPVIMGI